MTAKAKLVAGAMLTLFGLSRPSNGAALKVGQSAPDFALKDQNGNTVKLSAYRGQRSVVLAFYIRAFTPGWTRELKAYQADIAKFEQAGAQVLGISVDSREKNARFAKQLGITFPVLSDETKKVSEAYGVLIPLIRVANRYTFVIDREGVIQEITKGGEAADPAHAGNTCSLIAHRKH